MVAALALGPAALAVPWPLIGAATLLLAVLALTALEERPPRWRN